MRALLLAAAALALLAGCGDAPVRQVRATFAPPTDDARAPTATVTVGRATSTGVEAGGGPRVQCDVQNSVLQDSGSPLLLMDPLSPRRGETVTVTSQRLPPGPRRLILMTPLQRDVEFDVTVGLDGRLRATFVMPAVVAGTCAMLLLDGAGVQSLGFPVRD